MQTRDGLDAHIPYIKSLRNANAPNRAIYRQTLFMVHMASCQSDLTSPEQLEVLSTSSHFIALYFLKGSTKVYLQRAYFRIQALQICTLWVVERGLGKARASSSSVGLGIKEMGKGKDNVWRGKLLPCLAAHWESACHSPFFKCRMKGRATKTLQFKV